MQLVCYSSPYFRTFPTPYHSRIFHTSIYLSGHYTPHTTLLGDYKPLSPLYIPVNHLALLEPQLFHFNHILVALVLI